MQHTQYKINNIPINTLLQKYKMTTDIPNNIRTEIVPLVISQIKQIYDAKQSEGYDYAFFVYTIWILEIYENYPESQKYETNKIFFTRILAQLNHCTNTTKNLLDFKALAYFLDEISKSTIYEKGEH